jgi:LysM repeat protein
MNRQVIRMVASANLLAGCILLQGCGMFGKKAPAQEAMPLPGKEVENVAQPVEVVPQVVTAPVELPVARSTTPYTIQKGDTISGVAYKFNLRWQDVVAVNPGLAPNRLRVGQMIQLPGQVDLSKARYVPTTTPKASVPKTVAPKSSAPAAATGPTTSYVVKGGDSLSVIAQKHGVKTAALRDANNLKSDKLVVGQKLKVPGAKKSPDSAPVGKKASAAAAKTDAPKPAAGQSKPVEATPVVAPPPAVEAAPAAVSAPAPAAEAAPVAAPAPAASSNTQTYTVKEGEDLYAVAIRWGVSPSDLKALNNLTSTELKAGTVLKIPGAAQ